MSAGYGLYLLTGSVLNDRLPSKRRQHDVRNELYDRILGAFDEEPDWVKFPVSRNR